MPIKTYPFDAAELLDSSEAQADYLSIALEEGDLAGIARALGVVARAPGMTAVAKEAGLGRESLCEALREEGNPELATMLKVMAALGMKLRVEAA